MVASNDENVPFSVDSFPLIDWTCFFILNSGGGFDGMKPQVWGKLPEKVQKERHRNYAMNHIAYL